MSRLSWLAAAAVVAAVTVAVVLAARPGAAPDPGDAPADPAQHRVSPGAPVSDERLRSAKPMPKGG